jgi:hypothetical protein
MGVVMSIRRVSAVAAVSLLAACSSSGAAPATTTPPSSSVVASSSVPATSAVATSTTAIATTTTAAATTTTVAYSAYQEVASPTVPTTHTDLFNSSGPLVDGVYWVTMTGGDDTWPAITVMQAFFGSECATAAATHGDECLNDIYVASTPNRKITDLPYATGASTVFVSVADVNTQKSMWVSTGELAALVAAGVAGATSNSPTGFTYQPYAFLMTVKHQEITRFEQVWTP